MPKKSKKGPPQKRGKSNGKHPKKPTVEPEIDQPSTSQAPPQPETAGPSLQIHPFKKPSGVIIKKCEQIEKLAASIQQKCKIAPHKKELTISAENPEESVQELELLVSEIKKLAQNVSFDIANPPPLPPRPKELTNPLTFYDEFPYKYPRTKDRVPHIFLHPPADIRNHARNILTRNINMYFPVMGNYNTKILCQTFEDHKKLTEYFEEKDIPYHTFSYPSNKMLKVVIRGIASDVDLSKVKDEMIAASIPVARFHELNEKLNRKGKYKSIMVVVPDTEEGRKILKVKTIFKEYVRVESPLSRGKQCHRCQKWGHAQRFCRGQIKCVKCAEGHSSKDCTRDPDKDPLKCANCDGEHTASYRQCPSCPDSKRYKEGQSQRKVNRGQLQTTGQKDLGPLMTLEDCRKYPVD